MNKKIFVSAGEISGDIHAANLIKALKDIDSSIEFVGNGGRKMIEAGLKPIYKENVTYSTVGLTDSLRFINIQNEIWKNTTHYLKNNKVDAVILVDHQGFNIPLAGLCKKLNIRVYYYFPPHVSIWGSWNAPKLASLVDGLFVPYYEDYLVYLKYTDKAYYYGHPLVENVANFKIEEDFYEKIGIAKTKNIVGIFPGSRFQEIETLTPVMLRAAKLLSDKYEIVFLISVAHPDFKNLIENYVKDSKMDNIKVIDNMAYSIMSASNFIIASSGTTTLESVLFEKPVVICYKISPLSFFIGKLLVKEKMIGLPNIIMKEKFLPELLQKDCNEKRIFEESVNFIEGRDKKVFIEKCKILKEKVGKPPIVSKIAKHIFRELYG
ncbi:MAG: lipid-A-disaccharide synthase [Brevinematales bacterium]|nr:lipid-A-disaccharide synthase [Brevinematales bacterium]